METKRTRNGEPPMSGYQVQKVTTLSVGKETGERLAAQMLYTNAVNKLQAVLDQIRKEYGFLRAAEWPVMVPLDASMNVILEDFCGVELNLREGYWSYDRKYYGQVDSKTRLPSGEGWIVWSLCRASTAKWLFENCGPVFKAMGSFYNKNIEKPNRDVIVRYKLTGVTGISVSAMRYFSNLNSELKDFNGEYELVADIHEADLKGLGINGLCYFLNRGLTPVVRNNTIRVETGKEEKKSGTNQKKADPKALAEALKKKLQDEALKVLKTLYDGGMLQIEAVESKYVLQAEPSQEVLDRFYHYIIGGKKKLCIDDLEISAKTVRECAAKLEVDSGELLDGFLSEYLEADQQRADLKKYDSKRLEDPNGGLWELFENDGKPDQGKYTVAITVPGVSVYSRDPRADIQENAVIGIDFGTKSTVVVRLDQNGKITPMRVGTGRYELEPKATDYENPTVMQFIGIESFKNSYMNTGGRPRTRWSDLTISHTAFQAWQGNEQTDDDASFFGELKQWAGNSKTAVRIRDKKKKEVVLPPYQDLKEAQGLREDELDPIELYAYYIGLYINNMHIGHIYTRYLLSFPVTYELEVRNNLKDSFTRGLKRSLPDSILKDAACMEKFRVEEGVSEPVAYAACALQEFHLVPKEGRGIFYGVFDFGGGTADFDFGVWRRPTEKENKRRYNYVLEEFGSAGDRHLGGENILELMAYEVFKKNQDALRKDGIEFTRPSERESDTFAGYEGLLSDSREARTNTRQLMERLRPLWERHENYEKDFESGEIKLRLFTRDGVKLEGYPLHFQREELENLIRQRIKKGVDQFFDAMKRAGKLWDNGQTGKIHIFLAGNASKAKVLQEIFEEKCKEMTERLKEEVAQREQRSPEEIEDEVFDLFYPLGSPQADARIGKQQNDLERPTGKTGVAIGLVQCRKGGKIKVKSEKAAGEEIKFGFWVGYDNDGYFEVSVSRDTPYGQWVDYYTADESEFEFLYTTSPSAGAYKCPLDSLNTKTARCEIPQEAVDEDCGIFLRAVGPNEVEYVVAVDQSSADRGEYCCAPIRKRLE